MSSGTEDNAIGPGRPPITPRSSSLRRQSQQINGQEVAAVSTPDSDGDSANSENEKERVREKLKKTSIAGINAMVSVSARDSNREASSVSSKKDIETKPITSGAPEADFEMGSDNKSEVSDASSTSSSDSRKRSRDPEDDGDDIIEVTKDRASRPRAHGRKRSRELSDEEAKKKEQHRQEDKLTSDIYSPANKSAHSSRVRLREANQIVTPEPPSDINEEPEVREVHMESQDRDQAIGGDAEQASPPRKSDGRKRIREEGYLDPGDEVQNKKPLREETDESEKAKMGDIVGERDTEARGVSSSEEDRPAIKKKSAISPFGAGATGEREPKSETKIPPGSGFANTSSKSPFATASAGAKPLFGSGASTTSLFANSKFGAMSGSTVSPFGKLGASSSGSASPFSTLGSPIGTPLGGGTKPSGFGQVGFGSTTPKAFSSGFGALAAKSGDLISSAPKVGGAVSVGKPAKPFGAPETYDKEGSEDEEGDSDDASREVEPQKLLRNELAQEKEHITGEENEITVCHFRCKLYHFDIASKSWKERGVGTLKLNASQLDLNDIAEYGLSEGKGIPERMRRKIRLVMRADAVHKVILNVPLLEKLSSTYGDDKGSPPTTNNFKLVGIENGKEALLLIKLKNNAEAKTLYNHIMELLGGR